MRRILGATRFVVALPAVAAILGGILLMLQGSVATVVVIIDTVWFGADLKTTTVDVLTAIDAILLGTVLLVIGYGLYELFVDADLPVPAWLRVTNLDDLKSKLVGVVVAIIAVIFVGVLVDANRAADVMSYGIGAGAIVAGLALFSYATRKDGKAPSTDPRNRTEQHPE
ncbi:YqhA family protein [Microcella sp.]|uniref:YqhA family protein n=1 Tax=Microcella sp. TaxID=1913979 RepID=UPI003F71EB1F